MMHNFEDQHLVCADCGKEFVFSAKDQAFYAQKGFMTPKRCSSCRASRSNGGASRGGPRGGAGSRRGGPRQQFPVTCSACGIQTTVPFEPTAGNPVYCSACYKSRKA